MHRIVAISIVALATSGCRSWSTVGAPVATPLPEMRLVRVVPEPPPTTYGPELHWHAIPGHADMHALHSEDLAALIDYLRRLQRVQRRATGIADPTPTLYMRPAPMAPPTSPRDPDPDRDMIDPQPRAPANRWYLHGRIEPR